MPSGRDLQSEIESAMTLSRDSAPQVSRSELDDLRAVLASLDTPRPGVDVLFGASNWLTWTPAITAQNGGVSGVTIQRAEWLQIGNVVFFDFYVTYNISGTASTFLQITLPVTPLSNQSASVILLDAATWYTGLGIANGNTWLMEKTGSVSFSASATGNVVTGSGFYRV